MSLTDSITLADGSSIYVFHIEETEQDLLQSYLSSHPRAEEGLDTLHSIKVARKRKQWLSARILSAQVIKGFQGIYYDQFGAPHLSEDDTCVSYSHSYDKVAMIINPEHEVGIDIQKRDPKLKRISSKFLNEEEAQRYTDSGEDLDYLHRLWSIKECVFKVHKHHMPFKEIRTSEVLSDEQGETHVEAHRFDGLHSHKVHYHQLKGYYLAYSCYND